MAFTRGSVLSAIVILLAIGSANAITRDTACKNQVYVVQPHIDTIFDVLPYVSLDSPNVTVAQICASNGISTWEQCVMPVRNIEYGCNTPSAEVLGSLRAVYTTAMVEAGLSFADVSLMLDSTNAHLQLPLEASDKVVNHSKDVIVCIGRCIGHILPLWVIKVCLTNPVGKAFCGLISAACLAQCVV